MQLLGGPSWDKQTTTYGTVHVHEKRGPDTAGGRVGLRRSEIIGVYPQDLVDRPTDDHIRVWESYAKRDKYREAPIPDDEYRIAHGAEIWFTGDRDPMPSDEVALLPGAWLAAPRHDQGAVYFPAHRIDSVHTHTSDEQESAGWFR